jgi:chloride channel 3/4/5
VLRLRQRRSFRGRLVNALDRSLGWFVVSIVGFLTAILAFGIVRLEQWFFDIKEGMCMDGWYKAKRFCCPYHSPGNLAPALAFGNDTISLNVPFSSFKTAVLKPFSVTGLNALRDPYRYAEVAPCERWLPWSNQFGLQDRESEWVVEYAAYTVLAVSAYSASLGSALIIALRFSP